MSRPWQKPGNVISGNWSKSSNPLRNRTILLLIYLLSCGVVLGGVVFGVTILIQSQNLVSAMTLGIIELLFLSVLWVSGWGLLGEQRQIRNCRDTCMIEISLRGVCFIHGTEYLSQPIAVSLLKEAQMSTNSIATATRKLLPSWEQE